LYQSGDTKCFHGRLVRSLVHVVVAFEQLVAEM